VAIKILPQARNDVEKSVSRFLAEARAAAKLNHPNIVRVHDCDVVDQRRFMVMDLVCGSNLGEIVERHGPLSYRNAILMLKQAAAGLGHAHENGVTHRDVKPHNFLVEKSGQLKVADMGLALFEIDIPDRHTQDGTGSIVGTVDYLSPEQAWDSRKVDRRADMYSLGCTLYFMITGRPPFQHGTLAQRLAKHQTAAPTPLTQLRPDCPAPIWNLCQKMMAKKPQDRLQKMSDVIRICDQLLPLLNGGRDIAALASDLRSNSDSNVSMSIDGWQSCELLGLEGMDHPSGFESAGSLSGLPSF
jgi:serine/threonine-protein kinase